MNTLERSITPGGNWEIEVKFGVMDVLGVVLLLILVLRRSAVG